MSELIEFLRRRHPSLDENGYSDEEVSLWYADQTGTSAREAGEYLGIVDPNQGNFSRGIDSAIDSTQGMLYGAVALGADTVGATEVRNSALRGYQQNMAQVESRAKPTDAYEGINNFGDAVDFASYYSGYGLAQGAEALVTGGLGGVVGKQIVKQGLKKGAKDLLADTSQAAIARGGKVGGYAGIGANALGTELGATYGGAVDRSLETGGDINEIDLSKVYGYGTLAGAAEFGADVATLGLARFGPAKDLMGGAAKSSTSRLVNAAKGAVKGSVIEGTTEGVQTGLEDLGAGYSSEEARFFDPTSVLAGAIGGGQLGGAGGALRRPQQSATEIQITPDQLTAPDSQLSLDLDNPNAGSQGEIAAAEQSLLQDEQAMAKAKSEQNAADAVRREMAKTYSKDDMKKERNAQRKLEIEDPTSELGQKLKKQVEENRLLDLKDIAKLQTELLNEAAAPDKDTVDANYEAALDRLIEQRQQENEPALDFNQPSQQDKAAVAAEQRQVVIDTPATTTAKAIAKMEALFGEDWVNSGKYDDIEQLINGKWTRKKFDVALDKVLNPPIDVNASTTSREDRVLAAAQASARVSKKLKGDQKPVFDTFVAALYNDESDKYIQANVRRGKKSGTQAINFTQLAKDAGIKGDGSVARNALLRPTKLWAKEIGVAPADMGAFINSLRAPTIGAQADNVVDDSAALVDNSNDDETRLANETGETGVMGNATERAADQQDEITDASEALDAGEALGIGGGFNQIKSIGEGVNKGRDPEEKAFTDERVANQVDEIYEQRVAEAQERQLGAQELMLKTFIKDARKMWGNGVSKGGPKFEELSAPDIIDWVSSVAEHHETNNDTLLAEDLRRLETLYDAKNDGVTMESLDGLQNQDASNQGSATNSNRKQETGNKTDTSNAKNGKESGNAKTSDNVKQPKFGIPDAPVATASRAALETATKKLTGETSNMRVHVFNTESEAFTAIENGTVPETSLEQLKEAKPYGWVIEDQNGDPHAHFILDRIAAGRENAAFLHEVGGHVGIDSILDSDEQRSVAKQIYEWAAKDDNTLESRIARRAVSRIDYAAQRGGVSEGAIVSEAVAYFLEEATLAGVDPSVNDAVGQFVKKLKELFIAALEKIGMGNTENLTAQEIVDMAYGAARIELMHGRTEVAPITSPSNTAAASYGVDREWVGDKLGGPNAKKVYDNTAELAKKASLSLKFVHNLVRDVRETMPAVARWYDGMIKAEATRNQIRQEFADVQKRARSLKSGRLATVNKFLGESTFEQKWGYDPKEYNPELFTGRFEGSGDKVDIDPVKRSQFKQLSTDEQQIVIDIFAHGERMRRRKAALAKMLGVEGKFFTEATLAGPYAPLKRFGNYVAELKTAKLIAAERLANEPEATKSQKEAYEKLKTDPDHYIISFFDTPGAAGEFIDKNKKNYAFSEPTERAPNLESDRVSNPEVYEKVMAALAASKDGSMDAGSKTAFRDMVRNMYFQSLDERSARTSGARRLNRAGYEQNMIRSFINHGKSEAGLIAQMENGTEINTALAQAEKETRTADGSRRDAEKQRVFNSISSHYQNILKRNDTFFTRLEDRITTMNSVYMLLTSIGYHVTNATQPFMVSVPRIAGDFGNYSSAWSGMFRGYKYSRAAATIGLNMETQLDLEKVPQEYRALLKTLQDRQLIDQGMEEDGSFDRFNTGFEMLNQASDVLGTITSKLYNVAKFVEAQNRISSAVAAYDAARANPTKLATMKMTPEQYAIAVVEDTQGNFSQLDAPLLIKALPKVVVQYRKYQLLMAWHYSNAFKQGFKGETPEMKAAGKRILGYSIAHAAMGAGATGVPLLSTAFWLTTFLGDEDEPQDMERWIKENVDDGMLGSALSRGLFSTFGLDLSTKLNQSKIFHPLPYVDFQSGEAGAQDILMGLVGPAGTTGVNFFRAAEYFKQGDVLKGIEYSVPKGIRSVAESYRLATEGYTTKMGTVIVDPREMDARSLLLNAMGLPSSEINRIKWTRGQQFELEQYFNTESSKIRKQYIEATKKRDRASQAELRQEFRDLQKSKDRVRPFFNDAPDALRRQSISTLLKAPRRREKLEKKEQLKLR